MRSLRSKLVLLFLVVTIPTVLAMVYYQQVVAGAVAITANYQYGNLVLSRELIAIERESAVVLRLIERTNRGKALGELTNALSNLRGLQRGIAERAVRDDEWKQLSAALTQFLSAVSSGPVDQAGLRSTQSIVSSEIENLVIRLVKRGGARSSVAARQPAALGEITVWAAVLMIVLSTSLAWLVGGRYVAQLRALQRWVKALAAGETVAVPPGFSGEAEIAEVVRAFEELQHSIGHSMVHKQYLEDLLNSMNECVVVSNLVGEVVYVNNAARQLLDPHSQGMLGRKADAFIRLSWSPATTSDGSAWYDGPLNESTGNSTSVFARRTHLIGNDGALQGTVYVVQDVSESKALVRANLEYRDKLARSEQLASFGTLGAIVAHKFSQPLSSVRLFLQQSQRELIGKEVPEVVRENLGESLSELSRIAEFTRQMVVAGKERAKCEIDQPEVPVSRAIERVFDSLRYSAARRQVTLHNLCNSHDLVVGCPGFELEELLYSLINNSIQAAPGDRPAQVTVSAESDGENVSLVVCDTCCGISHNHLDKIFEWCFTTKSVSHGAGLGLAIVRSVVERHGGHITVQSEEGVGSRFSIVLPIPKEAANENASERVHC